MYTEFQKHLQQTLAEIKEAGLYKNERVIITPQSSGIKVATNTPSLERVKSSARSDAQWSSVEPSGVGLCKIPAAWLIEQCGWKGKTLGGAQVWPKQPLVIVNADHATPEDIIALAGAISKSVKDKFGISISPEVNYI